MIYSILLNEKEINRHYSPILHRWMHTRKGKVKFENFSILLDIIYSYTIVMKRLVEKLYPKKYDVMQWHKQDGNITTNLNVEVDFTLTELSVKNIVKWKCQVDETAEGRYDMILGRYILIELILNLNSLITSSKQIVCLLKGLCHPWLIWVRTN